MGDCLCAEWRDEPNEPGWWIWCDPEDFDPDDEETRPAGLMYVSELFLRMDHKPGVRWLRVSNPFRYSRSSLAGS